MTESLSLKRLMARPLLAGAGTGLVYGLLMRAVADKSGPILAVVSLAFLFAGPVVLGFLTVRWHPNPSWWYRILAPWLPTAISLLCFLFLGWEGGICILMALPTLLPLSSVGGILGGLRWLRRPTGGVVAAIVPFVLSP